MVRRGWIALVSCSGVILAGAQACSSSDPVMTADGGFDASAEATASDASMESAAMDTGTDSGVPRFCTNETPQIAPSDGGVIAKTTHYELHAETTSTDATNLARILEASSLGFQSWFERPAPASPSRVNYYKDQPSWAAGMMADGITPPANAGGYYSPSNQTVYLFQQGNLYYSHVLLVHEATHQFHYLTRLKASPVPFWYVEGHAEYLSRHDWDGSCVSLGVMSLLSYEDLPAQGLAEGMTDFAAIINGSPAGTRADAWAIFRNLDTGPLRPKFKMFRDAFDANMSPSFSMLVAPPAMVSTTINGWLPTAQEPMTAVFAGWTHVGPHSVDVDSPVYLTIGTVKQKPLAHFEGKFQVPMSGKWLVGAVVSYTDPQTFVAVLHGSDGKVLTFTAIPNNNLWTQIGTAPPPNQMLETFSVDQANGMAKVTFNGSSLMVAAAVPRVGLAASDTTGRFIDIDWK
jgi:hypothetical protein